MSQKKPSWKDLKPIIEDLSSKEMLGLIRDLYNFCPENKEFFHVRFLVQGHLSNSYLKPYKDRISIAVSPEEPWKDIQKLSDGRKEISDFKKVKGGLRDTLELMLYYVQCGNDFTLEFGDIDEPFYDSMEAMFSGIVKKLIQQKDSALTEEFMPKLEAELKRVDGEMGWGVSRGFERLDGGIIQDISSGVTEVPRAAVALLREGTCLSASSPIATEAIGR